MARKADVDKFIINVSAMEGKFYRYMQREENISWDGRRVKYVDSVIIYMIMKIL